MTGTRSPVVVGLLYSLQFTRRLDDPAVDRVARAIIAEPLYDQTIPENLLALRNALASQDPLTGALPQPHSESEFRDFLGRVLTRLEELHPWEEPPFRRLSYSNPEDIAGASVVGRIPLNHRELERRLRKPFSFAAGDGSIAAMVLRLRTGEVFALTGPRRGDEMALRTASPDEPAALLAAFREATGLRDDEVIAVVDGPSGP